MVDAQRGIDQSRAPPVRRHQILDGCTNRQRERLIEPLRECLQADGADRPLGLSKDLPHRPEGVGVGIVACGLG